MWIIHLTKSFLIIKFTCEKYHISLFIYHYQLHKKVYLNFRGTKPFGERFNIFEILAEQKLDFTYKNIYNIFFINNTNFDYMIYFSKSCYF